VYIRRKCSAANVLFVCVSFNFTAAPISPAISLLFQLFLYRSLQRAVRAFKFSVGLINKIKTGIIVPEYTRKNDSSPTCSSETVLKTNIDGSLDASGSTSISFLSFGLTAFTLPRSFGDGPYAVI